MGTVGFGKSVAVKSHTGGGSEFGFDVVGVEVNTMVTGVDGFTIVTEGGFVGINPFVAPHGANGWENGNA